MRVEIRWSSYRMKEAMDYLVFRNDMPPAGCRACGGPYPYCKPSCRMFDD